MLNEVNYTLFIIGAGAGVPYGFPTGEQLINNICHKCERYLRDIIPHGSDTQKELHHFDEKLKQYDIFRRTLLQSSTLSIDLFLSRNPEFQLIGRVAILLCLIEAEKDNMKNGVVLSDQNWLAYLFNRLTGNLTNPKDYEKLITNNIKFITFNYDRLFENFFQVSMQNSFSAYKNEVIEKIKEIQIEHVYGKLGLLNWQTNDQQDSNILYYGNGCRYDQIDTLSKNIKLIQDRQELRNNHIAEWVRNAKRIFFLGFGYADENLSVLGIPETLNEKQKIYGTALNNTINEITKIRTKINPNPRDQNNPNLQIINCDSLTLLRNYF